jgi:phosphopantothenoylcysteine decarboxylase/phosphopantothenate--cysteine ligase
MNTFMLQHPTVAENVERLRARGVIVLEPDSGLLACGDEGAGRMPDVPVLVQRVRDHFGARDLEGRAVLVTAGPTREPLDPVRFLSNRSSGKMGYAIADAARRRGARVTLVSGPTSLPAPPGVELVDVTTAQEMYDAVMQRLAGQAVVIKAAAVADYSPVHVAGQKIKKESAGDTLTITLKKNPDILAALGAAQPKPFLVAFAAETDAIETHAREKLLRKNADLIVANDVSDRTIGFDSDENEVLVIGREGEPVRIARAPKLVIANRILDLVVERLSGR